MRSHSLILLAALFMNFSLVAQVEVGPLPAAAARQAETFRTVLLQRIAKAARTSLGSGKTPTKNRDESDPTGTSPSSDSSPAPVDVTSEDLADANQRRLRYAALATGSGTGGVKRSSSLYIPGIGVIIELELNASLQVFMSTPADPAAPRDPAKEEWDTAAKGKVLSGLSSPTIDFAALTLDAEGTVKSTRAEIDRINRVMRETLALHGHRLTHVAEDENIVVVLRFTGQGLLAQGSIASTFLAIGEYHLANNPTSVAGTQPTHILKVPKSALNKPLTVEELNRVARVIKY